MIYRMMRRMQLGSGFVHIYRLPQVTVSKGAEDHEIRKIKGLNKDCRHILQRRVASIDFEPSEPSSFVD